MTGYHRKHALRVLHRPFVPEREGLPFVEFSWEGLSEGDSMCGRGWASLNPTGVSKGTYSST